MYLSKVSFQASQQAKQLLLGFGGKGVYSDHQILWQLFTEEEQRSFLFRQEGDEGGKTFFVLSTVEPKVDNSIFQVQSKSFMPNLKRGQRLSFKLNANPTVCVTDEQGKSKRHDVMMHAKRTAKERGVTGNEDIRVIMEQAAQEWLANAKRLETWGFTLDFLPEIQSYRQHVSHKGQKQNKQDKIQFSSVDYQGVLTVQDPERFITQLEKGFGRAKSLGCGLMLIKPI